MKLRARLDLFSAALFTALGVAQLSACGGSAVETGGSAGSGAATAVNHFPCQSPTDNGNGLITCDSFTHRAQVVTCASRAPRPDPAPNPYPAPSNVGQCTYDADCADHPHGWCASAADVPADIGGTFSVAAIEAREALEHASDPQLCELLQTISQDETRHAELAFRFVKWALSAGDAALRAVVRDEFEALQSEAPSSRVSLDAVERELLQNGVVPQPLREAVRVRAIADVILPCARALYAAPEPAALGSYRVAS